MAKLGSITLESSKDVLKGDTERTSAARVFAAPERSKEFELLEDVEKDKTAIKVTVGTLGSFNSTANVSKKKGEKVNFTSLVKYADMSADHVAEGAVTKGDKVEVTFETI